MQLQLWVLKTLLSFHHSNHDAPLRAPGNLGKMAIRGMLWPLGLCVLYYYRSPRVLFISMVASLPKIYSSHLNWGARLYSFDLLLNTRRPASF